MACSDNVVRAGLTPKYIDVDTLCQMLNYNCEDADKKRFQPISLDSYTQLFSPPVPDFAVAKILVSYMKIPSNACMKKIEFQGI